MESFSLTVRMSLMDAHYGGHVVSGARILELFGDAVTGLSATELGDESLLASWNDVRFLKAVHPGDFIRVEATLDKSTKLRRFISVSANRVIRGADPHTSSVEAVDPAECVADAHGVVVVPAAAARKGARQ